MQPYTIAAGPRLPERCLIFWAIFSSQSIIPFAELIYSHDPHVPRRPVDGQQDAAASYILATYRKGVDFGPRKR